MTALQPGGRFGDYTVVRRLGKGGMGEVWLLKSASGGLVAAKILGAAADHESRRRFLREAELVLGVKHPNLVETYDVGEDPDTGLCYILMEYVPGGTLADYIKTNGAMAIDDAVAVVEAMAAVLELGRQKGIVHRDIKPANIMFASDGTPKLVDLGIARAGAGTDTTTVTQTGAMIGTPAYMSPEQMLDAHNVDTRADIYSLGVVFFEMLTGERPNKDDTIVQLMAKAVKGEPLPDVRTLRPEVSASLAQLLNMMVAPDKDGRISTPGQITNALAIIERGGQFEADGGEGTRHPAKPARARPATASQAAETKSRFPWKALIPVGLLAGLAAAFWLLAPKKIHSSAPTAETVVREVVRTNIVERSVVKTNFVERGDPDVRVAEKKVARTAEETAADDVRRALPAMFPGWQLDTKLLHPGSGIEASHRGRGHVLMVHPPNIDTAAILSRRMKLPKKFPCLVLEMSSGAEDSDFLVSVRVDGQDAMPQRLVCTPDVSPWERIVVPLNRWRGREVRIEIVLKANNWYHEHPYFSRIDIVEGTGKEPCGAAGVVAQEIFPRADFTDMKWMSREPWLYTVNPPPVNWKDVGFDDSKWSRTVKPLGYGKGKQADAIAERGGWTTGQLWLRRKFSYHGDKNPYKVELAAYYDENAEVYLNGTLILPLGGWSRTWIPIIARASLVAELLREGENVLAVKVQGDGYSSYFDCGMTFEMRTGQGRDIETAVQNNPRFSVHVADGLGSAGTKAAHGVRTLAHAAEKYLGTPFYRANGSGVKHVFNIGKGNDFKDTGGDFFTWSGADFGCQGENTLLRFREKILNALISVGADAWHEPRGFDSHLRGWVVFKVLADLGDENARNRLDSGNATNSDWWVRFLGFMKDVESEHPDFLRKYFDIRYQKILDGKHGAMSEADMLHLMGLAAGENLTDLWHRYGFEATDASDGKIKTAKGMVDPESFRDPDATRETQKAFDALFPGWKVSGIQQQDITDAPWAVGYQRSWRGRNDVVTTMPKDGDAPCILSRTVKLDMKRPVLAIEVASQNVDVDFLLSVKINGKVVLGPRLICTPEDSPYERILVPLSQWKGKSTKIEIEQTCNNWFYEHAFWGRLEIVEGTGKETCGPVGIASTEVFPRANLQNKKWMKRSPWAYTMREPPANWKDADFDDSKWKHTKKALGYGRGDDMKVADVWQGERIWIRKKFQWSDTRPVYKAVFDLYYDQDIDIYLNGVKVRDLGGWNTSWVPHSAWTKAFASALRQGENVLAFTLRGEKDDGTANYFDCGLTIETREGAKKSARADEAAFDWLVNPPPAKKNAKIIVAALPQHFKDEKRDQLASYFASVDRTVKVRHLENRNLKHLDAKDAALLFLWSRDSDVPYSDKEIESITRYLNGGGNVMVIAQNPNHAQDKLLSQFGLGVERLVADLPLKAVCPGLVGDKVYWRAKGRGCPLEDSTPWHSMIVRDDWNPNPVMAMRQVGKGKLFFVASGTQTSYSGNSENRGWWSKVLRGCGIPVN